MNELITINNENHVIMSQQDVIENIRIHMGDDMGRLVEDLVIQATSNDKVLEYELRVHEETLSSYCSTFAEIIDELKVLRDLVEQKRINKPKVLKGLSGIKEIIDNVY